MIGRVFIIVLITELFTIPYEDSIFLFYLNLKEERNRKISFKEIKDITDQFYFEKDQVLEYKNQFERTLNK